MSLQSQGALLEEIGRGMVGSVPAAGWTKIELDLSGAGGLLDSGLVVTDETGKVSRRHSLDNEALAACVELREVMYQEGSGTWYTARLTVDRHGHLESEFDYDNPPLDGHADPELLEEDQKDFPRDNAHLPHWHPSKLLS